MKDNTFYINTFGKIVKLRGDSDDWVSIHAGIVAEVTGVEDGSNRDALFDMGWIAWGSQIYGCKIKKEPTQAQINTVYSLGFTMDQNGEIKPNRKDGR